MRLRAVAAAILLVLLLLVPAGSALADRPWDDGSTDTTTYDDGGWYGDDPSDDASGDESTYPGDMPAQVDLGAEDDQPYDDGSQRGDTGVPARTPLTPVLPALTPVPVARIIPGAVARIRTDGKAAIPRGAPKRVRSLIAAANKIIGKPYKWGGGHARPADTGYDCSGAVSYALRGGGLLAGAMVSGTLARWQSGGAGHWVTIYANKGHVYMEVAGLRLDTSPVGDPTGHMGVRWRPIIGKRPGFSVRHPAGL